MNQPRARALTDGRLSLICSPWIPPEPLALKVVTSRQVDIVSPTASLHEFIPLVFEEAYLSCLKLSVHSVLMGFTSSVCRGSKGSAEAKDCPLAPEKRDSNMEGAEEELENSSNENPAAREP